MAIRPTKEIAEYDVGLFERGRVRSFAERRPFNGPQQERLVVCGRLRKTEGRKIPDWHGQDGECVSESLLCRSKRNAVYIQSMLSRLVQRPTTVGKVRSDTRVDEERSIPGDSIVA